MSIDAYAPLNDRPREAPDPHNAARLRRVREALAGLLAQVLDAKQRHNGVMPPRCVRCIGLFGGLGQGKSSVVLQALDRLKTEFPNRRYYFFNVSDYAANDLTRDFDRIVGMWKSWKERLSLLLLEIVAAIAVAWICIALLNLALPDDLRLGGLKNPMSLFLSPKLMISVAVGVAFFSARGPLGFWWRGFERRLHTQSVWAAIQNSCKELWHRPDIIVIDDLDRASVAQQRAMLRSIHRFSQRMPYLFVICMDESLLLREAKPDPETPADLLRKVIQVELRLPARVPEDAVPLGLAVIAEAARDNPDLAVLKSPLFQADFCLLLSLLSGFGPRLAKRLLNDALSQARALGVLGNAEDCAALVRLHLCLAEFPELRGHSHRLTRLLEGRERFDDASHQRRFDELNRRCAQVRPLDNDWRRLVGAFGETRNQRLAGEWPWAADTPLSLVDASFWKSDTSRQLWAALESVRLGYGERQIDGWKPFDKYRCPVSLEALEGLVFIHLMVMLANTPETAGRLRLFDHALRRLEKARPSGSLAPVAEGMVRPDHALERAFEFLGYALLRAWLADGEVMAMLSDDKKERLARGLNEQDPVRLIYLLPLLEDGAVPAADLLRMLLDFDAGMSRFDVHLLRRWLRGQRRVLSEPVRVPSAKIPAVDRVALLNEVWPPLPPAAEADSDWPKPLCLHLRRWRELSVAFPELRPNALVAWLATPDNWRVVIRSEHRAGVLAALRGLFEHDGNWRVELWRKEWVEEVIEPLLDPTGLNDETWEVALLLACLSGKDEPWRWVGIHAIETPGLGWLLCKPEIGAGLWSGLDADALGCLFNGLTPAPYRVHDSEEWAEARRKLIPKIPHLVSENQDEYAILKVFDIPPFPGGR